MFRLMLVLALAACLVLALCLIPRSFDRSRLMIALSVLGLLAAFGVGSWLLSLVFAGVGNVAYRIEALGVPPLLIPFLPLIVVGAVVYFAPASPRRSGRTAGTTAPETYRDDAHWYSSQWERDMDNPDHNIGTAGYRLELMGGPLAGRHGRLRDSRFRLWVARPVGGGELIVRSTVERPALQGVTLLGAYEFSHGAEAMVWTPAVADRGAAGLLGDALGL